MRVLVTGVSGQDGSYLADQLAGAGHDVWGMVRSPSRLGWAHTAAAEGRVEVVVGDLLDQASLEQVVADVAPHEVYNLAAITAPGAGWAHPPPPLLAATTGLGVLHLCEAVRLRAPDAHLVHASSSAVADPHRYGLYGAAKRFAHDTVVGYRDGCGLRASNAILYSHTSPRQDRRFLARYITAQAAAVAAGRADCLIVGNVDNRRDWGYAPDHMRALPLIARTEPGDWVIASGRNHSVRDLIDVALAAAGLSWDVVRAGSGPSHSEPPADPSRARTELGWNPAVDFETMIQLMVRAEL